MNNTYPQSAGWTEPTTSKQAAEKIEKSGRAKTIRDLLMDEFKQGWHGDAYQAADRIGKPFNSVRPRITELYKDGQIDRVWQHMGPYGTNIWVFAITEKQIEMKV